MWGGSIFGSLIFFRNLYAYTRVVKYVYSSCVRCKHLLFGLGSLPGLLFLDGLPFGLRLSLLLGDQASLLLLRGRAGAAGAAEAAGAAGAAVHGGSNLGMSDTNQLGHADTLDS